MAVTQLDNHNPQEPARWQIWADTGGTFTDCLAVGPDGQIYRTKVLSHSALRGTALQQEAADTLVVAEAWNAPPDFVRGFPLTILPTGETATVASHAPATGLIRLSCPLAESVPTGAAFEVGFPFEPPVLAARLVTQTLPGEPLPADLALRVATTRGTNALLTRQGTPPALFITAGFADLLEIGTQQRPDLFALNIVKPLPWYGVVVEVEERLVADGTVLRPLNEDALRTAARRLRRAGIHTAAVALLHAYQNPAHEQHVAAILREEGFSHVSAAAELAPFIKLLPRAQTAVLNAYLAPVITAYAGGIADALPAAATLHLMTSAGGLVRGDLFRPCDSLLSGPAGGIIGAAQAGKNAGFSRVIAFDMGGTSTDVARFEASEGFEYSREHTVGDAQLVAPALAIESVAAGGGSVCYADQHGLHVGQRSAGATPGPACYGAGGPLCITDVNLLLGRLTPDRFEIPLSTNAARQAAGVLVADVERLTGNPQNVDLLLEGLLDLANERMADAIRRVSLRRGYDPADYTLVAFGGAGGQHGCAVASRLGMKTVIVPPDASLLSAWGLGQAAMERFAERQVLQTLNAASEAFLETLVSGLCDEAIAAVVAEGVAKDTVTIRQCTVALRLAGQESTLSIEYPPRLSLADAFSERYQAVFGYLPPADRALEIESVRVVAGTNPTRENLFAFPTVPPARTLNPLTRVRFDGEWDEEVPVWERDTLTQDGCVSGPALIVERHSTTVVEPGWSVRAAASGALILSAEEKSIPLPAKQTPDAIQQELYAGRFAAIAEEMGEVLRRTSLSTNVRERLDFSCALLSPEGELVASAAHIPVHLGALGLCVRRIIEGLTLEPGDTIVTNHPAFGGSHLPDITVITPVYATDSAALLGFVACRAHHAEIGGTRPGSMPPNATTLIEEGVVLPPLYLVRGGESCLDDVCRLLTDAPFPSRNVGDNRADLIAALAANRQGAEALQRLAAQHGAEALRQQMTTQIRRAERLLRESLRALPDGDYTATERLDDGSPLCICVRIDGDRAEIDWTGTSHQHPGNLNAPPAVALSATLYVLRLLVREPLLLNEGLLRAVTLILPPGSLVNPTFDVSDPARCPAVVGGNTEVSQRLVDTLLRALSLSAGSQGTMNNTLWGNDAFGYYETVCGGAGATADAPGADAVHTHMTNTRITDAEILETRYPVRVEQFAIRHGSGGAGQHPGGDGVIREMTFLAPMALSVLTQHRTSGPYGMASGENGQPGRQRVIRETGEVVELGSVDGCDVEPGDCLILETPGGGGWGS